MENRSSIAQCGVEKVEHLLDDSGNYFHTYENFY